MMKDDVGCLPAAVTVGYVQFTKGAPDEIISRCSHALIGGNIVVMTEEIRADILAANKSMADRALRVTVCGGAQV